MGPGCRQSRRRRRGTARVTGRVTVLMNELEVPPALLLRERPSVRPVQVEDGVEGAAGGPGHPQGDELPGGPPWKT